MRHATFTVDASDEVIAASGWAALMLLETSRTDPKYATYIAATCCDGRMILDPIGTELRTILALYVGLTLLQGRNRFLAATFDSS